MIIVEDGSIVSGANSYVSAVGARKYLDDRAIETIIPDGTLIRGADYINSFRTRFKGCKRGYIASSMQWPRSYVEIDDYCLPDDVIPDLIIAAQIEAALEIAANRDPLATTELRPIRKQKLGPLEVEYDTSRSSEIPSYTYTKIRLLLSPVLKDNIGLVMRG